MNVIDIDNPSALFAENKVFSDIELNIAQEKKTAILVLYDDDETISNAETELLNKILLAAKITTADFILLNTFSKQISLHLLMEQYQPQTLLIFSNSKSSLGKNITLPLYEITPLYGIKILRSSSLKMLLTNTEQKSMLWNRMKVLFNI